MTDRVLLGELEGLRALARSLVHGDADADDLVQETAIAAIEHPPALDRPVRPWLATVLRNRWRMDRRGRSRREARELASLDAVATDAPDDILDRARALEKLAAALVALEEPFRTVVMRRYLDGESAADIARALDVPSGTVRWRLKTGLERLRAALDESTPRWKRAFAPLPLVAKGALAVKTKTSIVSLVVFLVLLLVGGAVWIQKHRSQGSRAATPTTASAGSAALRVAPVPTPATGSGSAAGAAPDPLPGQARATLATVEAAGGVMQGHVVNWSTGDGVPNAEMTFTSDAGAVTIRSGENGAFELAPVKPGSFTLAAVVAQGFLPFAPELSHSSVRAELVKNSAVRGVTVFLFPALGYDGHVVDAAGKDVPGAKVRLVGTWQGEQVIEKLATEWTSDAKGHFTFNAPDGAVFEATRGNKRGWASLNGDVQTTRQLTIALTDAPARDATIRGKVVDKSGAPAAEVLVRGDPDGIGAVPDTRAPAFAVSGPDGAFVLEGLDRGEYRLRTQSDDYAPVEKRNVMGGAQDVVLEVDAGGEIAGHVVTTAGEPVPSYTLLVMRRRGLVREGIVDRSIVDPRGSFSVRVAPGEYELLAYASGWAPSAPVAASTGAKDVKVTVAGGATLRGRVVDAETHAPLEYARVTREGIGGGATAQPANAGTVTRADGTFELTGIPPGPLSFSVGAGLYNPRLEGGYTAVDGGTIGPVEIGLHKLADGEKPKIDLVGIGVKLVADGEVLRVEEVVPNGGAADSGIVANDHITAVDGIDVVQLGLEGAIARIRGVAGTTVGISLARGETHLDLVVTRKPLRF